MIKIFKTLLICSALSLTSISFAKEIQCKVIGVTDGDTITCLTDEKKETTIDLFDIDAPELDQPYGEEAKQTLSQLVINKVVWMEDKGTGKNGVILGKISWDVCLPPSTEPYCVLATIVPTDINLEMIKQGYAWYHPSTTKINHEYQQAEQEAKAAKRALWSQPNPISPWEWRKQQNKQPITELDLRRLDLNRLCLYHPTKLHPDRCPPAGKK